MVNLLDGTNMRRDVAGFCPMGCGQTLALLGGLSHVITCLNDSCPRPSAASKILADNEYGHLVNLTRGDFSIVHPLRERLEASLLDCELNEFLGELAGPPQNPGRYRVTGSGLDWNWELLTS